MKQLVVSSLIASLLVILLTSGITIRSSESNSPLLQFYDGIARVVPEVVNLDPGIAIDREFTIAVVIEETHNATGYNIEFEWNTTYLDYVDHTVVAFIEEFPDPVPPSPYGGCLHLPKLVLIDDVDPVAGTYETAMATIGGPQFNGNGTAFVMTFRVKNQSDVKIEVPLNITYFHMSYGPGGEHWFLWYGGAVKIPRRPDIVVPDDCSTISEALSNATEGDQVFVRGGTYSGGVDVGSGVELVGEGWDCTVIQGSATLESGSTLIGFTLNHSGMVCVDIEGNDTVVIGNRIIGYGDAVFYWGIYLALNQNNTIIANSVENFGIGIQLESSMYNTVVQNNVLHNHVGIRLIQAASIPVIPPPPPPPPSSFNKIYHNNFFDNDDHTYGDPFDNEWEINGEGNYWNNYNGFDLDDDGVGDTDLPWEGVDQYPLMKPWSWWNTADVNHDLSVDIFDTVLFCNAYGSTPSTSHWNLDCDIIEPYGIVNIFDIVLMINSYGEEFNPYS